MGSAHEDFDGDVDAEGELDQLEGNPSHSTLPSSNAPLASASGVSKRYRPAQAKTFQCRGYGECRMVFSRSEHLARHIRKHTGERPFSCHCGKQFSRLDNLRQHAQTVHADKPTENEAMMRQLASLHATITGQVPSPPLPETQPVPKAAKSTAKSKETRSTKRVKAIKQEEENVSITVAQRPGTSTGYEGAVGYMDVDVDVEPKEEQQPSPPLAARGSFRDGETNHSFRDYTRNDDQSFRVNQSFRGQHQHQYFSRPSTTPSPVDTPGGYSSKVVTPIGFSPGNSITTGLSPNGNAPRPSTSNGSHSLLPPLSSVVPSASLTFRRPSTGAANTSNNLANSPSSGILLPNSLTLRRPSTGDWNWDGFSARPGTAPGKLAASGFTPGAVGSNYSSDDASPFSFHVPDQPTSNSRKRTISSTHGPYGSHPDDDESQSRPTSRRLSVMDLVHDDNDHTVRPVSVSAPSTFALPRPGSRERDRPITTNGLVSRASALDLSDEHDGESRQFAYQPQSVSPGRSSRPGSVRGRPEKTTGGPVAGSFGAGGGLSSATAAAATTTTTATLLSGRVPTVLSTGSVYRGDTRHEPDGTRDGYGYGNPGPTGVRSQLPGFYPDTVPGGLSPFASDSPFSFLSRRASPPSQLPGLALLARQLPGLPSIRDGGALLRNSPGGLRFGRTPAAYDHNAASGPPQPPHGRQGGGMTV